MIELQVLDFFPFYFPLSQTLNWLDNFQFQWNLRSQKDLKCLYKGIRADFENSRYTGFGVD